MGQNSISFLAVLAALTFLALALASCASPAQMTEIEEIQVAVLVEPPSTPEFHGARIGGDALRSRLPGE